MPEYFRKLTIPANTPENKPVGIDIEVEGEVLSEIAYLIPPGWCALAHFALFYGIEQIYPEELGTWITGDNVFRVVPLKWNMPEWRTKISIRGWNEDDTYEHSVFVWLLTATKEEARPWEALIDFMRWMKLMMAYY